MRHSQIRRVEAIEAQMGADRRWDYMVPQFLPQTQEEALAIRNAELERDGLAPIAVDGRIAFIVFRAATNSTPMLA